MNTRRRVSAWIFSALALLLAVANLHAQDGARSNAAVLWVANVSYVVDGDSVWVRVISSSERRVRVRLEGIDAPEICQNFGHQARQALEDKLLNERVLVSVRAYDRYGRAIARITRARDGADVAAQMVREGWAWTDAFRNRPGQYQREQALAQRQRRGLFADDASELPRDFRKRHGSCAAGR